MGHVERCMQARGRIPASVPSAGPPKESFVSLFQGAKEVQGKAAFQDPIGVVFIVGFGRELDNWES